MLAKPCGLPVAQKFWPETALAHQLALDAGQVAGRPKDAAEPFTPTGFPRAWKAAVGVLLPPRIESLPDALARQVEGAIPTFHEHDGIAAADLVGVALVDLAPDSMAFCGFLARAGVIAPRGQLPLRIAPP